MDSKLKRSGAYQHDLEKRIRALEEKEEASGKRLEEAKTSLEETKSGLEKYVAEARKNMFYAMPSTTAQAP